MIKKTLLLFFVLSTCTRLSAQLCQGSLGDPIINITFGAGTNPGPALTTTKNLSYKGGDCPNDGSYTVANSTSRCFNDSWHTLNTDHTGNANGYFMLINASLQKSEFYIDTIKGLCPSTTYEFAAWIMNVILPTACLGNSIKPNLTFNIERTDGTVLRTYNSGDIPPSQIPNWSQYGFFFTTPSTVSDIVLRLLNNSTGGCGNDIAIDDITFRPCGPLLTPSIRGAAGRVKELCFGDNANVTLDCNVSSGFNNPSYLWQQSKDAGATWIDLPGETKTSLSRNFPATTPVGDYLYRLTVGESANTGIASCKVASALLTVRVNSIPVISISSNSPGCEGGSVNLSASGGTQGAQYIWTGANSFSGTGSSVVIKGARLDNSGKYYLQVTNPDGCKNTDFTTVLINPAPVVTTTFTSKTICRGETVSLNSSGGTSYLWSPFTGLSSSTVANPDAKPVDTTIYKVIVANAFNCTDSAWITINVLSKPQANAGPDKVIVEGQTVQLEGSLVGGNTSISWSPNLFISNIHTLNPLVSPAASTGYTLTATSNNGCGVSIDSMNVHVYKKVIIPNAFSPNDDGVNDRWNITALNGYDNYELSVFNRYGQQLFVSRNYSKPWDGTYKGKPLPVGTYYYLLDLKLGLPKVNGYVVILR